MLVSCGLRIFVFSAKILIHKAYVLSTRFKLHHKLIYETEYQSGRLRLMSFIILDLNIPVPFLQLSLPFRLSLL